MLYGSVHEDIETPTIQSADLRRITWEELELHNKRDDFWVSFKGTVYDVTKWADNHPGGFDMIHFSAGKDVTDLFVSYHKLASEKLFGGKMIPAVGKVETEKFASYKPDTGFYRALKLKSEQYFKENEITNVHEMGWAGVFNTVFIFAGILVCLFMACYTHLPIFMRLPFAALGGLFYFLSLTHVWHEVSHNTLTSKPLAHRIFAYLGGIITGQCMYIWLHRHVYGHHVYTNVAGIDPDIGIYKCTKNTPVPEYRAPYIIVPAWIQCWMYVFSTFQMQLDDWFSFFRGSMENIKINDTGKGKTAYVIFTKVLFYLHRIILPIVLGFGIIETILNLMVWYAVSGMLFGYFSQITHISDEREWPIDDPRGWGELQVLTSCDYAQDSYFWTYLSGYLNYQVTHHLFPSVNPRHYVKLLPMVIETCKEYNIQYTEYKTFWEAAARHLNHLEQFQGDKNSDSIFTMLGRALGIGPRVAQTSPLSESRSNSQSGSVN